MRILTILSAAAFLVHPLRGQGWPSVPAADFSQIQLSQFADHELEVPYFLRHFAQVANAVVETGEHRGFLDIKVNREPVDNQPHNARIMEMQAALAYFYTADRPWNPYRGNAAVRVRLEAMLDRWHRIQAPPGHPHAGLFTEYSSTNWSLAPTGFGVRHAAEAIDLIIDSGLPFDATILENARISLRRALMAMFTRSDMRNAARQYSNQFSGAYHATLIYLENWPDGDLDTAFVAALHAASTQDQSPAGFWYEQGGPDVGYTIVHDTNMRIALPRLRQRSDLMPTVIADDTGWNRWLAAMLVPQPDLTGRAFLANAGIGTRTNYSVKTATSRPWSEWVETSRIFSLADTVFAAATAARRTQVQSQFGNWGPLAVPSSSSYIPAFVHDAVTPLNTWHPSAAQRDAAHATLDCLAPGVVNRQFRDPLPTVFTTAKRPQYYAVVTTGNIRITRQVYGLGLLWSPAFGTALQSVAGDLPSNNWIYGTRRSGAAATYETANLAANITAGGVAVTPVNGEATLPTGDLVVSYPLAAAGTTYGEKSITLGGSRVDVTINHSGAFTELLPLAHAADAAIAIAGGRLTLSRPNGSSFTIEVHTPGATIQSTLTAGLTPGMLRRAVAISASEALTYSLILGEQSNDFIIGHWPFDTDMLDASGFNATMNPSGTATLDPAIARVGGGSLRVDQSADHAVTQTPVPLGWQFTLSAWIRLPSGPTSIRTIAANSPSGFNSNGFRFFVNRFNANNGELVLETGNGSQAVLVTSPEGAVASDVWQHVAAAIDRANGQAILYLNGSQVATGSIRNDFANNAPLAIGAMIGSLHGLRGHIDDVRIFSRVLSAAEINAIVTTGGGRPALWTATTADQPLAWSSPGHWALATTPEPGPECDLDFLSGIETSAGATIVASQDISAPFTARSLRLGGSGSGILRIGGTPIALVANGPGTPAVALDATGGITHRIEAPVIIASNLTVSGNGDAAFVIQSAITGSGGIVKTGPSTLVLDGPNTFSGNLTVQSGSVRASHDSALGSPAAGTTVQGASALATLDLGGGITTAEPIQLVMHNTAGHTQIRNVSGLNTLTGPLSLNSGGARWDLTSAGGWLHVAGPVANIANPGSPDTWRKLNLNGPAGGAFSGSMTDAAKSKLNIAIHSGEWLLTGAPKAYTGTTEVTGGSLAVDAALQSRVIVSPGAVLRGQGGSTSSTLELQDGAILAIAPVSWENPPATFTAGQLQLARATLRIDASQLAGFTETPRSFPVIHVPSGIGSPDPSLVTIDAAGFPGSGRWSVTSNAYSLALDYQPDLYQLWSSGVDWQGRDSSPQADPDGDNAGNFLEYALGGDPLVADSSILPAILNTGNELALGFSRIADPSLVYEVHASDDLAPDAWRLIWSSTGAANVAGFIIVPDPSPDVPRARRFLRLQVGLSASGLPLD